MNFVQALKNTESVLAKVLPIADKVISITGAPPGVGLGVQILENMAKRGVLQNAGSKDVTPDGVPIADPVQGIPDAIVAAEAAIPEDGKGPEKLAQVISNFETGLAMSVAQELFAKLDPPLRLEYNRAELELGIKEIVSGYNRLATVKASVKLVPIK